MSTEESTHENQEHNLADDVSLDNALPFSRRRKRASLEDWVAFKEDLRRRSRLEDIIHVTWEKRSADDWWCSSPLRPNDDKPSFHISIQRQVWKDFGLEDKGGDVFEYLQRLWRCDFREALRRRAEELRVPLPAAEPLTAEEQRELEERHLVEKILTLAAAHFNKAIPADIREHLNKHYGITDETIETLLIGFDDGSLYDKLKAEGYNDDDMAITGLFEDTNRFRTRFVGRITFPYWRRGRAVYFAARETKHSPKIIQWKADGTEVEVPRKYLKLKIGPDEGELSWVSKTVKNDWFWGEDRADRESDLLLIAEGMPDAISAYQAGFAVVSPITLSFRDADIPKLIRLAKRAKRVVLIPDQEANAAGMKGAIKTCEALCKAGIDARILVLPHETLTAAAEQRVKEATERGAPAEDLKKAGDWKIDLNEWMRGRGRTDLEVLIKQTPSYVQHVIEQLPPDADPEEREDLLRPIIALLVTRPKASHSVYIDSIVARLPGTHKKTVNKMLEDELKRLDEDRRVQAAATQGSGDPSKDSSQGAGGDGTAGGVEVAGHTNVGGGTYCVVEGRHCRRVFSDGVVRVEPLSNFVCRIVEVIEYDDGNGQSEDVWRIVARLSDGRRLPEARPTPKEFLRMDEWWQSFGPEAQVFAGRSVREHLRVAVQANSPSIRRARIYRHTGWTQTDSGWAYLHGEGAIGGAARRVELPERYAAFSFSSKSLSDDEWKEVTHRALKLAQVATDTVALPLLCTSNLAPLASILKPRFSTWLLGKSETGKSELAKLHQRRFGSFETFAQGFDSTPTSVERGMNRAKDALLVIDDFNPKDTSRDAERQKSLAHMIIRHVGNRAGKGRARATTEDMADYPPRAVVLCTAEENPVGFGGAASLANRMFVVTANKGEHSYGSPEYDGDVRWSVVSELQGCGDALALEMREYIGWLAPQLEVLREVLPLRRAEHLGRFRRLGSEMKLRMRQPDMLADLFVAMELWLLWLVFVDAIDATAAKDILDRTEKTLIGSAESQAAADDDRRPEVIYMQTLEALFISRTVTLAPTSTAMNKPDIGWFKDRTAIINANLADAAVFEHLRRSNRQLGTGAETIHAAMADRGWVHRDGKNLRWKGPGNGRPRDYLKMPFTAFDIDIAAIVERQDADDPTDTISAEELDELVTMPSDIDDEYERARRAEWMRN